MMTIRFFSALALILPLMFSGVPALAGSLNISNGQGMWQSTACNRPVPPAFVGLGPDSAAGTLNAATASYNLYVKQMQEYNACLSAEAKADADSSNALIMQTVERNMAASQAEAERVRGQLFGGSAPAPIAPQPR